MDTRIDECILWDGALDKDGYGFPWSMEKKKRQKAHRLVWEEVNGRPIPEGLVVMHTCDTPTCITPDHLRLGTVAENNKDRAEKNRSRKPGKFCWRGHPLWGDNIRKEKNVTTRSGWVRRCLTCKKLARKKAT